MRFLNPKTDYAFKKIFGSEASRDILISFLNAILALSGRDVIDDVTVLDPHLAPRIDGMKNSFLDVRVRDQRGRSYIVEMQVLRVEGFEKRILFNACKAYVHQLNVGDPYHILTEVVAVTITDFVMYPDLAGVISRFRLRADENPLIVQRDLELVFAELPKFVKTEANLDTVLDRWLYFIKTARDLSAIPQSLAVEPAIVHAFELANEGAWSREELDELQKREMWIGEQRYILELARTAEQRGLAKGKVEGLAEGEVKGKAKGKAEGLAEGKTEGRHEGQARTLLRQLERRFGSVPDDTRARVLAADLDTLDRWLDRVLDAQSLDAVFKVLVD